MYQNWPDGVCTSPFTSQVKVGTDCAGIMGATMALEKLGLEGKIKHVFTSEKEPYVRRLIAHNFGIKAEDIADDVMTRDNAKTPRCDIYTAGFPCQPFSVQGLRQGEADALGRGLIAHKLVDAEASQGIHTRERRRLLGEAVRRVPHIDSDQARQHQTPRKSSLQGAHGAFGFEEPRRSPVEASLLHHRQSPR